MGTDGATPRSHNGSFDYMDNLMDTAKDESTRCSKSVISGTSRPENRLLLGPWSCSWVRGAALEAENCPESAGQRLVGAIVVLISSNRVLVSSDRVLISSERV
jgi:hypothetical protein